MLVIAGFANADPDLNTTWMLYDRGILAEPSLTQAGAKFRAGYDFKTDDPSLQCVPASWTRVFSNPNTPFEIIQSEDNVRIRLELFDIDRTVALVRDGRSYVHQRGDTNYPTLGDSIAWYDGDALLIHSSNFGDDPRVLSTIRNWAGLPQSPMLTTLERFHREDDKLNLEITHFDPLFYDVPLVAKYQFDLEEEFQVQPYGCDPESATIISPETDGQR